MAWFTPVDRTNHPCLKPEAKREDWGRFWRCEVCDDLYRVRVSYIGTGMYWERVTGWLRWRYRKLGYGTDED